MNYLELVQRAKRECGISGPTPVTVVGLSGEMLRLADWVRDAYIDIQNAQAYWRWLDKTATINLAAGDSLFHPVTNWGIYPLKFDRESFRLYTTSIGPSDSRFLRFEEYTLARQSYYRKTTAAPTAFTERPSREIEFNAILEVPRTLVCDYYATAEELNLDADTPSMPEQYHLAIIWKVLQFYADYEEVAYVQQRAERKFTSIYDQMLRTEAVNLSLGGSLA